MLAAHYELKMPPLLANEQFLAQVDQTILPAADFYRLAVERDHLLVENTLALMEVEGKQRAAMVVGGFHADGIKRLLAREGINYLLITPTISKTPLDNPYLSIMLEERIHCPQTDDSSPALANPVVISETPPGPITEMAADLAGTLRHEAYQRLIELVRDKDELRSPGERFSEELQLLSGLDLEAVKAAIALIENDSGIKDARIKLAELRSLAEVLAARIADQTTPAEDIEEDQPAAVRSDQSFRAGAIYIGILAAAFISIIIPAFLGVPLAITIANNLLYAYLPVVMPIILLFYQSYRANILAGEAGTAASPLDEYWEIRLKFGWLLAPFVYIHELTHRVLGKSEFAAYTVEILAIIISAPVIIAAVFCALVYRLVQMMARKHPAFIVYLFLYAPLVICLTVLLPSVIGFTGTIGFAFSATMVPALGGIFLPNRAERPQPSLPAVIFSPNKHLVINKLSPLDFIDISFSGVDKDRARLTIKAAKDGSGYEFYANGSLSGKFLFKE